MKKSLGCILIIIALFSCKKNDDRPKQTFHIKITSSHDDSKFVYFGNDKQRFTSTTFESDFLVVQNGATIVYTGFERETAKSDHSITIELSKGLKVVLTKTQKEAVSVPVYFEP